MLLNELSSTLHKTVEAAIGGYLVVLPFDVHEKRKRVNRILFNCLILFELITDRSHERIDLLLSATNYY